MRPLLLVGGCGCFRWPAETWAPGLRRDARPTVADALREGYSSTMEDTLHPRSLTWTLALTAAACLTACNPVAKEARTLDASCGGGDAAACNELGARTAQGDHVLRDWRRASELYGQACDGSVGEACVRLARLHVTSSAPRRGVSFDSTAAAALLDEGCSLGAMPGCIELGDMYLEADSVVPGDTAKGPLQDLPRAAALYRQACDGDAMEGCAQLGRLYQDGRGVELDAVHAVALYRQACDGGAQIGCAHLGEAYAKGTGLDRDPQHAMQLFETACETEMAGCYHLADLLVTDPDIERDYDRAVELFEKACRGTQENGEGSPGMGVSCFRLGDLYANGTGVSRDVYQAGNWFRRACRLGYAEACRRS